MKIFNTQSGKKEDFIPLKDGFVGIYVCGPTVYDLPHLGHGRSAVSFDVIRRYFSYKGFGVKFVSNYTDIDDKMINRANQEGISVAELTNKIIPEYELDYGRLGILPSDVAPKATEHIEEMIFLIKKLEAAGHTYVLDDGVYFDVESFAAYGELSGQNLEELKMGARVEVKESKKNPHDFVLWKFKKEGEPFWASPWGDGRPGWHIECSAMSHKHLGEKFDIHGGGLDLVFPHHECEVAQSKAVFGTDSFAKYWIHNGFINIDNEKMSKSLGNFFTLRDILNRYPAQAVRLMFMQTHYRNPINFSLDLLDQSKAALARLQDFVRNFKAGEFVDGVTLNVEEYKLRFDQFMDNDFDTSGALGVIFELLNEYNSLKAAAGVRSGDRDAVENFLKEVDKVLGVIFFEEEALSEELQKLIEEREEARKNRDFKRSDEIRDLLIEKGIVLEDGPNGTIWKRA